MKKLFRMIIILIMLTSMANAMIGFLTGERISGMNKICYYDVLGSTYTLNISSTSLCPLSYDF